MPVSCLWDRLKTSAKYIEECIEKLSHIKKIETSYLEDYGLRSVHMSCLLNIMDSDNGVTATRLASACGTDKALISRILKELIACDFIYTEGEGRAYNKKYTLTEKGKGVVSAIEKDIVEYMTRARVGIPEESMQAFYDVMRALENNISLIASDEE